LARKADIEFIASGHVRYTYPEAWERFIGLVPVGHRINGASSAKYFAEKLNSNDTAEARKFSDERALWENTTPTLAYEKQTIEQDTLGDKANLPIAKLEAHYFLNNCSIPENYILESIEKIKHLPCYAVQGRFDNCTPPIGAYCLSKTYGDTLTLQFVNAGHI
jgi:proline iminopeptidase